MDTEITETIAIVNQVQYGDYCQGSIAKWSRVFFYYFFLLKSQTMIIIYKKEKEQKKSRCMNMAKISRFEWTMDLIESRVYV